MIKDDVKTKYDIENDVLELDDENKMNNLTVSFC
jgi:hypothetical protein